MKRIIAKILRVFHYGFCCDCGRITKERHQFCDSVDAEGQPDGYYWNYCHDECFEGMLEGL